MKTVKEIINIGIDELITSTTKLKNELEILCSACNNTKKVSISSSEIKNFLDEAEKINKLSISLKFYNNAIYANRGKSSPKKKISSRENGKLGGRPPKVITDKKKRIAELNDKPNLSDNDRKELDELWMDITVWENRVCETLSVNS